jgi:hypothetical protein
VYQHRRVNGDEGGQFNEIAGVHGHLIRIERLTAD